VHLVWTVHAVSRYAERVKPALTDAQAKTDLHRLERSLTITHERPTWLGPARGVTDGYLLLGEDIVFPFRAHHGQRFALTCLTRGGLGDHERQRRATARRETARARRILREHPFIGEQVARELAA